MDLGIRLKIARTNADDSVSSSTSTSLPRWNQIWRRSTERRGCSGRWVRMVPGLTFIDGFSARKSPSFSGQIGNLQRTVTTGLTYQPCKTTLEEKKPRPRANPRLAVFGQTSGRGRWPSKFEVNFARSLGYK